MPESETPLPGEGEGEVQRSSNETLERRLDDLHDEVRAQGDSIRTTGRNFTIFAVMALVLSLAMLIAVAAKLDGNGTTTTQTVTSAATASTPAAATTTPAAATPAAPVPAAPAPAALPSTVAAKLTEMKIAIDASTVRAGKVTFEVANDGTVVHELVLLKTATPAAKLKTDAAGRADESGNVGETSDMKPGATKTLKVNLAAGHYAVICNLPGHYKAGMFIDLTVK